MSELIQLALDDAEERMDKAVEHARSDFASIRTGRAAPALVERLMVGYHGTDVPMQQMASFNVPDARQLVISPFDKAAIPAIERSLQESDLGLTPSSDGIVLRLTFPPLTEERRRDLVKVVKGMAEDGKVAIRNARRAVRHDLEALQRDGDASEDDVMRAEKTLDTLTHAKESEIEAAMTRKEEELMEV